MTTLNTKELIKKVKRIEIQTRSTVNELFAGKYNSTFKGRGMEFDEVREYIPGDDIRSIDWNVTARSGRPHIKKFTEERELTVMLLVDISASNIFGSRRQLKRIFLQKSQQYWHSLQVEITIKLVLFCFLIM